MQQSFVTPGVFTNLLLEENCMSILNITHILFTRFPFLSGSEGGRQTHKQEDFIGMRLSLEGVFLFKGPEFVDHLSCPF